MTQLDFASQSRLVRNEQYTPETNKPKRGRSVCGCVDSSSIPCSAPAIPDDAVIDPRKNLFDSRPPERALYLTNPNRNERLDGLIHSLNALKRR